MRKTILQFKQAREKIDNIDLDCLLLYHALMTHNYPRIQETFQR